MSRKKLAEFLDLIEERIAIQNRVIEDSITLEKELQNQIYSRLQAPVVPLSTIAKRVVEKNTALTSNNVLTISARDGLVSQLDFFNKSVASENLSNYFLLERNDFAYNKSYSSDYPWGAIKHLERYETGVLSPLSFCFRLSEDIVDVEFLQFYFETSIWHKHIAEIAVEGARNHGLLNMAVGDFFAMPIPLPSLTEQQEIAAMLSVFKQKRENAQRILLALQREKEYLLNQLFV
ncbi:MAG: restriction endonuclease subunit S [Bacteroidales bacterium]|nr:restriction endonuclease subunit S [Bacteroidales bacterium]MBR1576842.1 restriction endonuclease subunit S [Bacteroidales bacterium]